MPSVYRWVLDDLAGTTYTVPINPNKMSKLKAARAVTIKTTTAVGGQALFFEGQRPPQQFTFAGTLLDKDHFDALDHWVYNTGRIMITDHFLRRLSVVLVDFNAEPERSGNIYWRHQYTVTGYCYNVDTNTAVLGPTVGPTG